MTRREERALKLAGRSRRKGGSFRIGSTGPVPTFGPKRRRLWRGSRHPGRGRGPRGGHYRSRPYLRWLKPIAIIVVGLAVIVGVVLFGGYEYFNYRLSHIPRLAVPASALQPVRPGQPYDVLLVATVPATSPPAGLGIPAGSAGTDIAAAVVVARVDPAGNRLSALEVPASMIVPAVRKGAPAMRVGALYESGPATLVSYLDHRLGIPINHVVAVSGSGFSGLVDTFGGLSIDFPAPLDDAGTGFRIASAGCQKVTGSQALGLLAMTAPYYYAGGSWHQDHDVVAGRLADEAALLLGALRQAHGHVGNPLSLNGFIGTVSGHLAIDSTWSSSGLKALAGVLGGAAGSNTARRRAAGDGDRLRPGADGERRPAGGQPVPRREAPTGPATGGRRHHGCRLAPQVLLSKLELLDGLELLHPRTAERAGSSKRTLSGNPSRCRAAPAGAPRSRNHWPRRSPGRSPPAPAPGVGTR